MSYLSQTNQGDSLSRTRATRQRKIKGNAKSEEITTYFPEFFFAIYFQFCKLCSPLNIVEQNPATRQYESIVAIGLFAQ